MIVYLMMTAVVVFLSFFVLSKRERSALNVSSYGGLMSRKALLGTAAAAGIFTALFLVQAFRINVGND